MACQIIKTLHYIGDSGLINWCLHLHYLLLDSFFLDLYILGNVLLDLSDLGILSLLLDLGDLTGDKSQPLHHALEAGSLHQGLGNGAVLNLLGKRTPGTHHGSDAEGVGGAMDSLDIIAHSLGSVALRGLENGLDPV